jgi:hypothetical protein
MTQVPQVSDAQSSQVKDESGSLKRAPTSIVLIDGDTVDEDISYVHADSVPVGAEVDQSPKHDGVAAGKVYKVVVRMFSPLPLRYEV